MFEKTPLCEQKSVAFYIFWNNCSFKKMLILSWIFSKNNKEVKWNQEVWRPEIKNGNTADW